MEVARILLSGPKDHIMRFIESSTVVVVVVVPLALTPLYNHKHKCSCLHHSAIGLVGTGRLENHNLDFSSTHPFDMFKKI